MRKIYQLTSPHLITSSPTHPPRAKSLYTIEVKIGWLLGGYSQTAATSFWWCLFCFSRFWSETLNKSSKSVRTLTYSLKTFIFFFFQFFLFTGLVSKKEKDIITMMLLRSDSDLSLQRGTWYRGILLFVFLLCASVRASVRTQHDDNADDNDDMFSWYPPDTMGLFLPAYPIPGWFYRLGFF